MRNIDISLYIYKHILPHTHLRSYILSRVGRNQRKKIDTVVYNKEQKKSPVPSLEDRAIEYQGVKLH